jgi:ribonuclease P protein component
VRLSALLKKENRLKSRGDFKRTLAGRRLCINDCFVVYGLPVQSGPAEAHPVQPRVGFVVSKKIHKRAVQRNRIKRRLRELVRTCLLSEKREALARYRTLVFIARSGSLTASYQDLQSRMARCLQYF